jgi:hypothetical protein
VSLLSRSRDFVLSSRSLSLSFRDHGVAATASRHLLDCRPQTFPETDSLRLSFPSTHSGNGSPLSRVCLTLSVPLSGFLFTLLAAFSSRTLWYRFSGPSVPGIHPFRVFFPQQSRAFLKALCSPALRSARCGRASKRYLDFRAFLPAKSRTRGPVITLNPEPILSWGSPTLGFFSLPTLALTRRSLFCTFTHPNGASAVP